MRWKYKEAKKIVLIDSDWRTFHGVYNSGGSLHVNTYIAANLERILGFPVEGNVEIVAKIVGLRIPPNEWCRVEDKVDDVYRLHDNKP